MISYAAVTLSKLCNNKLAILDSGVEESSSSKMQAMSLGSFSE